MPKGTRVSNCVEDLKKKQGSATEPYNVYAVCQSSTKEKYASGEPMKKGMEPSFQRGQRVVIRAGGSIGETLDGEIGNIVSCDPITNRYTVLIAGGGPRVEIPAERLEAKSMPRTRYKDFDGAEEEKGLEDGTQGPEPDEPGIEAEEQEHEDTEQESDEPYGAQVLRRIHQDTMILFQDYDSLLGPLENEKVKARLEAKLEQMEAEMTEIEEEFAAEYEQLEPIDGGMDEEEGEAEDEKDLNEPDMEGEEDGQGADSNSEREEEEPTGEEVAEGMQTKALDGDLGDEYHKDIHNLGHLGGAIDSIGDTVVNTAQKVGRGAVHVGRAVASGVGKVAEHLRSPKLSYDPMDNDYMPRKSISGDPEEIPGYEENQVQGHQEAPGATSILQPHHHPVIQESQDFLKEISTSQDFGDEHRMKSFHYHKALDSVVTDLMGGTKGLGQNLATAGGAAAGMAVGGIPGAVIGGYAARRATAPSEGEEKTLAPEPRKPPRPGQAADEVIGAVRKVGQVGRDIRNSYQQFRGKKKDYEGDDPEMIPGYEENQDVSHNHDAPGGIHGEHESSSIIQHLDGASKFFKALSTTKDFGNKHREEALHHHGNIQSVLGGMADGGDDPENVPGYEENQDVDHMGDMGEKGSRLAATITGGIAGPFAGLAAKKGRKLRTAAGSAAGVVGTRMAGAAIDRALGGSGRIGDAIGSHVGGAAGAYLAHGADKKKGQKALEDAAHAIINIEQQQLDQANKAAVLNDQLQELLKLAKG